MAKRMKPITGCRRLVSTLPFHRAQKLMVAVVGGSAVLGGVAMLVMPGPAFLVIPAGRAILGTQFLWARSWLQRARALLPNGAKPPSASLGSEAALTTASGKDPFSVKSNSVAKLP